MARGREEEVRTEFDEIYDALTGAEKRMVVEAALTDQLRRGGITLSEEDQMQFDEGKVKEGEGKVKEGEGKGTKYISVLVPNSAIEDNYRKAFEDTDLNPDVRNMVPLGMEVIFRGTGKAGLIKEFTGQQADALRGLMESAGINVDEIEARMERQKDLKTEWHTHSDGPDNHGSKKTGFGEAPRGPHSAGGNHSKNGGNRR